ncbi:MAG: hypothetical protein ACP5N6_09475 [Anaerolineae bacterium]
MHVWRQSANILNPTLAFYLDKSVADDDFLQVTLVQERLKDTNTNHHLSQNWSRFAGGDRQIHPHLHQDLRYRRTEPAVLIRRRAPPWDRNSLFKDTVLHQRQNFQSVKIVHC